MSHGSAIIHNFRNTGSDETIRQESEDADEFSIVGRHPRILRLREDIRRYAPATATVLVTGETGTGKELVARALHDAGDRRAKPFVVADATTLHSELFESELFGHERGAFTGALVRRRGLVEEADSGTLFVDEIGELSLSAQGRLLRVLESGEIRALGSNRTRRVSFRLVAATNRKLAEMVRDGSFREDLFYRLHVLTIRSPALRDRREDIRLVAHHLLHRIRDEVGHRELPDHCCEMLERFDWPGNVRQLLNVLRRAAIRSDLQIMNLDVVTAALAEEPSVSSTNAKDDDTGPSDRDPGCGRDDAVRRALSDAGGSISRAARTLGIARSTLRDRMQRFGVVRTR